MTINEYLSSIRGKRVAVVGVGVSNRPLIRLLENAGAHITLHDKKPLPDEYRHLTSYTGERYLDNIDAEIIFRSPGVKPFEPQLERAVQNGAIMTSEIEVFMDVCPCLTYGVTGSDGKTTTTTIIGKILEQMGYTVHVGGNIGTPLLDKADSILPGDMAVLELSSFQLMTMRKSPRAAVITNLSPNHLDWHRSMDEYVLAKTNIYKYSAERVVLNYENHPSRELNCENAIYFGESDKCAVSLSGTQIFLGGDLILDTGGILVRGAHNVQNYMAAIAAIASHGMPRGSDIRYKLFDAVKHVAATFRGVEHRQELVAEIDGVKYYNDSMASSPTRTVAALNVFDKNIILIAGGRPKVGFDDLAAVIDRHVKAVLLVGEAAGAIRAAFDGKVPLYDCGDIPNAVTTAHSLAENGDTVLLSPACTSFDQFANFAERGERFKACVQKLIQ